MGGTRLHELCMNLVQSTHHISAAHIVCVVRNQTDAKPCPRPMQQVGHALSAAVGGVLERREMARARGLRIVVGPDRNEEYVETVWRSHQHAGKDEAQEDCEEPSDSE